MLEKIKYVNSRNQIIESGTGYFYVNENDLRDYTWNYETNSNHIVSFNKDGVMQKSIDGYIIAENETLANDLKNNIFNIFEYDIINKLYGKLYIGKYYLNCFIVASKKSDYLKHKRILHFTLTIVTDINNWILENKYSFNKNNELSSIMRDYKYDYKYDYYSNNINKIINNETLISSNFKWIVYGSCVNPSIIIDGHVYNVNIELFDNERLEVDSKEKKINIIKVNGDKVNVFNYRNRDSYIFELISSGIHYVSYSGLFNFDLILYSERSEPEWI